MSRDGLSGRARPWLAALLAAAVLGGAAPCRAQSPRERATALLRVGNELFNRGELRLALEKYRQAKELYPTYRIDYNIGVTLFAMGHGIEAAEQLERVLRQAATVADQGMLEGARRRIEQLRRQLGRVAVICHVEEATLAIDGSPVGDVPFRRWIYLQPGKHRLAVTAPGHHGFARSVDLVAGDHQKVRVSLMPITERPRPADRRGEAPPAAAPFYKRWWFWTIVGAVVVGATVGGVVAAKTGGSDRVPLGELRPDM